MANRLARGILLAALCALVLSACSIAPRGKTIVLRTPAPLASATPAARQTIGLKKVETIDLAKLDQASYFGYGLDMVCGWLDDEHLAVVGTKLIAGETEQPKAELSDEEKKALSEKNLYARLFAGGIVGQILSVDWQTGEATELYTVQDQVITGLGLSHDKTQLWYMAFDGKSAGSLSVSDISFKHERMSLTPYSGPNPAWSSKDKYLYYINYNNSKEEIPPLMLFDGVSTTALPYRELAMDGLNLIGIDDDSGMAMSIIKSSAVIRVPLSQDGRPSAVDGIKGIEYFIDDKKTGSAGVYRAVWLGSNFALLLSSNSEDTTMGILDVDSGEPPYWHDGVINFAVSDDGKYICLVRRSSAKTADISVAEWNNGTYKNEALLFKDFITEGSIYFSPDNTKLFVKGRKSYADETVSAMVLQFR